ncbi:MAG: peptide chain release factor 1 [Actinomycetales bacterium]|nr:peptide chain release factor 1 [Actinomycetales bacterium]
MFEGCAELVAEFDDVERRLADPSVHADADASRRLARRHAELKPVVEAYRLWVRLGEDEAAALELAADDPAFRAEAEAAAEQRDQVAERLRSLLVPRDPLDGNDVLMEIKAGEGGAESALFAGDLLRMYARYAERRGWSVQVMDQEESDLGGVKSAVLAVKSRGAVSPDDAPYARLKFEGGVHRVQRVPVTESQGRIHTSAAGVIVLPEAEEVDIQIAPDDVRVDVYRSSGPGGQSVNTTDSAVRITHIPTGIVVTCQNEKSQLQNRESAMRILRARLLAAAQEEQAQATASARRSQVRTVDRSERIRTYNFPENRITDHRVGFKSHNLTAFLDGDLDACVQACIGADFAERLAEAADNR